MSVSEVSGPAGLIWQQTRAAKSALAAAAGQSPVSGATSGETGLPASAGSAATSSGTLAAPSPTLSPGMLGGLLKTQEQGAGTTPSNDNVHSMTNAELVGYAKSHGLDDIAESFQVDYLPMDRSAAGEAAMQQSLMSDPTKHDFVAQYLEAAQWQQQNGASDGGQSFRSRADELIAASAKDAAEKTS